MRYSYKVHSNQRDLLKSFISSAKNACVISGPAGVGKSSLIQKLVDDHQLQAITLKFQQFEKKSSLSTEIIRCLGLAAQVHASQSASSIQESDAFCASALKDFDNMLHDVCLLVIDDCQWMGMRDIYSLSKLFGFFPYKYLKVIFCFRCSINDEFHQQIQNQLTYANNGYLDIHLKPLSTIESQQLINELVSTPDRDHQFHSIVEASEGLPALINIFLSLGNRVEQPDLHTFIKSNLSNKECYVLFVCAQFGFCFDRSFIEYFFTDSSKQANIYVNYLINIKILSSSEKSKKHLQFNHDIIHQVSRKLYDEEKLYEVNSKLYRVFCNLPQKSQDHHIKIQKAVALIRSGLTFQNSIDIKTQYQVYDGALQSAINSHAIEQGYYIASFILYNFRWDQLPEKKRIKLIRNIVLIGHYRDDIEFIERSTRKAKSMASEPMHLAQIDCLRGEIYFSKNMLHESANYFKKSLSHLGVVKSLNHQRLSALEAGLSFLKVNRDLLKLRKVDLFERACTKEDIKIENRILCFAASATMSVDTYFVVKLISKVLKNTIDFGFTIESAYVLNLYSVGSLAFLRDYEKAVYYAELGLSFMSNVTSKYYYARAMFMYHCFIGVHRNTLKSNIEALHNCVYNNLKERSIDFAAYSAHVASFHRLDSDMSLQEVLTLLDSYQKLLEPYEQHNASQWMLVLHQTIIDLQSEEDTPLPLTGDIFCIEKEIPSLKENIKDRSLVFIAYHYRSVTLALSQQWSEALAACKVASKFSIGVVGTFGEFLHKFFEGVIYARNQFHNGSTGSAKTKLNSSIQFLKKPANLGSTATQSKISILQGYKALLSNDRDSAKQKFIEAYKQAQKFGHNMDLLIAIDAIVLLSKSNEDTYWKNEARALIATWGAKSLNKIYDSSHQGNALPASTDSNTFSKSSAFSGLAR